MVITPNSESVLTDFDMVVPSEHNVVRTEPSSRLMSPPIPSTSSMPASPLQHSRPLVVTPRRSPCRRNTLNSPIIPSHARPTSILKRRDNRLSSTFASRRQLIPSSQPRTATLTSPPTNEPRTTAAPTIARLSPTPALARPPLTTEPRRRRLRREPMLSAGTARRILIAESQRQTQIDEEKLGLWRTMIAEMRDLKELLRQRYFNIIK
ncbi:unnamed protein product [Arctia plantaginis]|uniref:Uncharacterized protein n=1 Tax=Arctia plantaginis TaxID=874455 RepID=A0A8S1AN37_ARCPL|nr:unnamed protein product [Arctia plantaginis]